MGSERTPGDEPALTASPIRALLLLGSLATASLGHAATITRGPYLQLATPDGITVRWRTDVPTDSKVCWGIDFNATCATDEALVTEHELRLVEPEGYYYAVGAIADDLGPITDTEQHFTLPPDFGTLRLWAIGDSGTGGKTARRVYDAYRAYTFPTATTAWLMLGDNAYESGSDKQYTKAVFRAFPELLKTTSLWPSLGNHDAKSSNSALQTGPYFNAFTLPGAGEAGGEPSGTEAYYSYDLSHAHFVVLDSAESDRSATGPMLTWLERDLAASEAEWKIAYFHHPPYSKGSHNSDSERPLREMRQNAVPILERYDVDLVLSGHSHSYERSGLIRGHFGRASTFDRALHVVQPGNGRPGEDGAYSKIGATSGDRIFGAVYVVAGSSGGKAGGGSLRHPAMVATSRKAGSVVLDIRFATLSAKFLTAAGDVLDHFAIRKDDTPIQVLQLQDGLDGYTGAQDTFLASDQPDLSFGTSAALEADADAGARGRLIGLLQWDVSGIPPAVEIVDAFVTLHVFDTSSGAFDLSAPYPYAETWDEATATWTRVNPLGGASTRVGGLSEFRKGKLVIPLGEWGLDTIRRWRDGTLVNRGLLLIDRGSSNDLRVRSSEYERAEQRPALTVIYRGGS